MSNLLADGLNALANDRNAEMASTATYRRFNGNTLTVCATSGRTDWTEQSESGVVTEKRSHDFIILTSLLVFGGVRFDPQPADEITTTIGGVTLTYRVMPNSGLPCWAYTSSERASVRVRTALRGQA
jgi:hypothetical protein